ncbi:MAG: hypothetical protein P8P98_00770 [Emcibacteraceae bacterium]|nr:hypothetical protein [Emcibacteraceae bacterium]
MFGVILSKTISINEPTNGSEISITAIVAHSYNFLTTHFMMFLKLSAGPILIWSSFELLFDYLYFEHDIKYESGLPRIFSTAAFVLIWYRYYLLGEGQATYKKLFGHMRRTSIFSARMFILSIARMVITIVAIIIPTLGISLYMMYNYHAGGGALTDQVIVSLVNKSVFFVGLVLSPIFVRLSLFSVAVALGRSKTTF